MWTHSTFCRARGALQMFRSLLGLWLGTTTGKKNRGAVAWANGRLVSGGEQFGSEYRFALQPRAGAALRGKAPALAVHLGAQRGLFALHLVAAQVTVDWHWPALPPRHRFPLATPGTLDTLCFNRHFPPFQTVTQVFYNTCVTAVKRPLFPLGGRVSSLDGGVR